jgi:hypothetical protein
VPTAGKQRADCFGWPVRGDGENVEAQAKPSQMEAASMTPAVTNKGEKRPVGRFEIKTRRSKPIERRVPEPLIHSRRPKREDV